MEQHYRGSRNLKKKKIINSSRTVRMENSREECQSGRVEVVLFGSSIVYKASRSLFRKPL